MKLILDVVTKGDKKADRAFDRIADNLDRIEASLKKFRRSDQFKKATTSLKKYNAELKKTSRLSKQLDVLRGAKALAPAAVAGGITNVMQGALRPTVDLFTNFVNINAELERAEVLMQTAFGGEALGAEMFRKTIELTREVPFSLDAISDSMVKLQTARLDKVTERVTTLADAVAAFGGTSEDLKLATIAIQQMAGKGVVSMEELRRQLGERIPTAIRIMAKSLGMTYAKLTDLVGQGKVIFTSEVQEKFFQGLKTYEGASERLMGTFTGSVARMKTAWMELMKTMGDSNGVFDSLKGVIQLLTKEIDNFRTSATGQKIMADLSAELVDFANAIKANLHKLPVIFATIKAGLKGMVAIAKLMMGFTLGILNHLHKIAVAMSVVGVGLSAVSPVAGAAMIGISAGVEKVAQNTEEARDELRELERQLEKLSSEDYTIEVNVEADKAASNIDNYYSASAADKVSGAWKMTTDSMMQASLQLRTDVDATLLHVTNSVEDYVKEIESLSAIIDKYSVKDTSYATSMDAVRELREEGRLAGEAGLDGRRKEIDLLIKARGILAEMSTESEAATKADVARAKAAFQDYFVRSRGGKVAGSSEELGRREQAYKDAVNAFNDKRPLLDQEEAKKKAIADIDAEIVEKAKQQKEEVVRLGEAYEGIQDKLEDAKKLYNEAVESGDLEAQKTALENLATINKEAIEASKELADVAGGKYVEMGGAAEGYGVIVDINTGKTYTWGQETISTIDTLISKYNDLKNAAAGATPSGAQDIPGKANGGDVYGGSPYIVGERGRELFVPDRNGTIIPNNKLNKQSEETIKLDLTLDGEQIEMYGTRQNTDLFISTLEKRHRRAA